MEDAFLIEYVANLGLDVFKNKIDNKVEILKVKKILKQYIKMKQKENEYCLLEQELDFEGFCICLRNTLIEDLNKYLVSPGKDKDILKNNIIDKAVKSACAKNRDSKQRVESFVEDIIDLLDSFYRKYKLEEGELFLVGEIEKLVIDKTQEIKESINTINTKTMEGMTKAKGEIMDTFYDYSNREINGIETYIANYIETKREVVMNHSIFPWFKESLKYRDVFPELFIRPILTDRNISTIFDDITNFTNQNIAILGEAGAGKSTLLRYLFAFSLINGKENIYITAFDTIKNDNILDKIIKHTSLSSTKKYLVFIDGIDEAFSYNYEGFMEFITKLQNAVNIKFWLGCRTDYFNRNYNENLGFISRNFTISAWNSVQSDEFIKQYSKIQKNSNLKDSVDELIASDESIKLFKSNPFQLSLLVFLADNDEKLPISGIYDLYERFMQKWIDREQKRTTSTADNRTIINSLRIAANKIYAAEEYILDEVAENNTAIRNLLIINEKNDIYNTRYSTAFYHRTLAAFLLAENLIEAFLINDIDQIKALLKQKLKDDVTNFIGNKFTVLTEKERNMIKENLVRLYEETPDSELSVKEQTVYYITRLGIDVSGFLEKIIKHNPQNPIMRLTIAYGCVLSENPIARVFALEYAKSISENSIDAITNRAWTVIYFGDVNDRDPYTYVDDEKRSWNNARKARIKRFTTKSPRKKDYRFRLFDIPLYYNFLKDRGWNDITVEEYNILLKTDFPKNVFNDEEILFLENEKTKLLNDYKKHLNL